jgi:hypothetical protein
MREIGQHLISKHPVSRCSGAKLARHPFVENTTYTRSSEVVIEPLECVTDEG